MEDLAVSLGLQRADLVPLRIVSGNNQEGLNGSFNLILEAQGSCDTCTTH